MVVSVGWNVFFEVFLMLKFLVQCNFGFVGGVGWFQFLVGKLGSDVFYVFIGEGGNYVGYDGVVVCCWFVVSSFEIG